MSDTREPDIPDAELEVEKSVTVDASPDAVWESIIDGSTASQWMGSPIEIEARPGGDVGFAPGGVGYIGTVEEVVPGHSITWSWRHPDRDPSQVTITIEDVDGATVVTVVERLIPYRVTDARRPTRGEPTPGTFLLAA